MRSTRTKRLKVIDLFCGAGGFSEGFKQAGFEIVAAVDNNSLALTSHEINHPETDHFEKVIGEDDLSFLKKYKPHVVIGSPPCQNFSRANTNADPEKGIELVKEFFSIIDMLRPKYFVGENVPQVRSYIEPYGCNGYILNSVDFGVPQKRERYFFGNFFRPETTHAKIPNYTLDAFFGADKNSKLKKWRNIADILVETKNDEWLNFEKLPNVAKKRILDSGYQKIGHYNHSKLIDSSIPAKTIPAHHDVGNMFIVSAANSGSNGGMVKEINNPGWTVTTRQNYFIINRIKFRKFKIIEIKRLMGFSDDYQIKGSRTQQIKQLGNAVTPPVAKAIGEAIRRNCL